MKTFKILISELFDPEKLSTKGITPDRESLIPGFSLERTYKTKVGDDEIMTKIDHSFLSHKSDIKFFVNGSLSRIDPKKTSDTLSIYNTVLNHIKHHIDNSPEPIEAIRYSYTDTDSGRKKNQIYQQFGKKFDIPVEPRIAAAS